MSKVLQEVRIVIQADKLVEQRGLRVGKRRVVEDSQHPSDYQMTDERQDTSYMVGFEIENRYVYTSYITFTCNVTCTHFKALEMDTTLTLFNPIAVDDTRLPRTKHYYICIE